MFLIDDDLFLRTVSFGGGPATVLALNGWSASWEAWQPTFEVLAASFGLEQGPVARLGLLVHYLDVGGAPPPEAPGVDSVLAGLRDTIADDDQLLERACAVFDGLLASFRNGASTA